MSKTDGTAATVSENGFELDAETILSRGDAAQLLYQAKVLGGPKQLSNAQVQRLYEIRRQFGLKGKHPADICPNAKAGKPSCHSCGGSCGGNCGGDNVVDADYETVD